MKSLDSGDLQAYLQQYGIGGEILHLDSPTPTVEMAAQAVGCLVEQIVKSILFMVNDNPVLTITCGLRRVELRALAAHFEIGRKKIKLVHPEKVLEISGYEVGAMPPLGHRQPLVTLIDPKVVAQDEVYAGGGAENALMRIDPQEILRFSLADMLDLHTLPES